MITTYMNGYYDKSPDIGRGPSFVLCLANIATAVLLMVYTIQPPTMNPRTNQKTTMLPKQVTKFGVRIVCLPDRPNIQLGPSPCRLPDGTEFDWITPEARRETNEWLLAKFGSYNALKDNEMMRMLGDDITVYVNPRTYQKIVDYSPPDPLGRSR